MNTSGGRGRGRAIDRLNFIDATWNQSQIPGRLAIEGAHDRELRRFAGIIIDQFDAVAGSSQLREDACIGIEIIGMLVNQVQHVPDGSR